MVVLIISNKRHHDLVRMGSGPSTATKPISCARSTEHAPSLNAPRTTTRREQTQWCVGRHVEPKVEMLTGVLPGKALWQTRDVDKLVFPRVGDGTHWLVPPFVLSLDPEKRSTYDTPFSLVVTGLMRSNQTSLAVYPPAQRSASLGTT